MLARAVTDDFSISPNEPLLRGRLLALCREVRALTAELAAPLSAEDAMISATEDTSPPKWHLAHTTWFFERFVLTPWRPGRRPSHPAFDFLFNSYYRGLGEFLPKPARTCLSRPSLSEVNLYRKSIETELNELFDSASAEEFTALAPALELAVNHEQQHQELLLMDVKRNFFANPLRPGYHSGRGENRERAESANRAGRAEDAVRAESAESAEGAKGAKDAMRAKNAEGAAITFESYREVTGGMAEIGAGAEGFAYDNERPKHREWGEPFAIARRLTTNAEFLTFLEAGGYDDPRWWLSDGWDWKARERIRAPLYWEHKEGSWQEMSLAGMQPLEPSQPVSHLSYYEADAFARWSGARLPTEAEWERAARLDHGAGIQSGNFLDPTCFHPRSTLSLHGTLWQWTSSAYHSYPGYRPFSGALAEYNGKFMGNQMVLRGGSFATPASHYRPTYRNFYYPHMRWQFAGLRLAKDIT